MIKEKHKELGLILRQARIDAGLTQWQVAQDLGYGSPQYISNYERGLCAPARDSLPLLAKSYKLDVESLIDTLLEFERKDLLQAFGLDDKDSKK